MNNLNFDKSVSPNRIIGGGLVEADFLSANNFELLIKQIIFLLVLAVENSAKSIYNYPRNLFMEMWL